MKNTLIASTLIALSLAASGSAFAQRGDHNDDHDKHGKDKGQQYHRDDKRGGGPKHDLRRGQRLGQEYRDNRYVVNDWRARRLSAPPKGHHWVRAGNDYVLAAIATGVITQVLLSN